MLANSVNLGVFFSLYFLVTGLALLVNGKGIYDGAVEIISNKGQMLIVGFMALIFGLFIISFHSYYQLRWPVLITIFGWMSFLKGVIYLVAPDTVRKLVGLYQLDKTRKIVAIAILLVAVFFAYNIMQV